MKTIRYEMIRMSKIRLKLYEFEIITRFATTKCRMQLLYHYSHALLISYFLASAFIYDKGYV